MSAITQSSYLQYSSGMELTGGQRIKGSARGRPDPGGGRVQGAQLDQSGMLRWPNPHLFAPKTGIWLLSAGKRADPPPERGK